MASIYDIKDYIAGSTLTPILKHTPVFRTSTYTNGIYVGDDNFYYALQDMADASANWDPVHPTMGSTFWGGMIPYGSANTTVPHFFWVPDYGAAVQSEPKVEVIQFGDGYEQRTAQNISANLIKLDLNFDQRDEKEATAIAHFLNTRGAKEAFAFTPPSPYGSMKKFVCRSWNVTMTFQNNHSIDCSFEEVVD